MEFHKDELVKKINAIMAKHEREQKRLRPIKPQEVPELVCGATNILMLQLGWDLKALKAMKRTADKLSRDLTKMIARRRKFPRPQSKRTPARTVR